MLRLAMGGAVLACAGSALAADWYAAPTGGGSLCSQASPCTIQGAIDVAAPYDTVHVAPGDYTFTSNRILIQTEGLRLIGDNSPFAQPYATPPGPGQVAHGTLNNKAANASVLKAASANVASGTSGMIWVRNVQNVRIENLYIEMAQARAKEGIVATGTVRGLELVNNYIKTVSGASGVGISINMDAGTNSSVPSGESRGAGEFVTVDGNVVEPTPGNIFTASAPKYAIGMQNSVGLYLRNQTAASTMDMTLKPYTNAANPSAQRVFRIEENWTFGRLGLYISGGANLSEPTRIANNHFVMSQTFGDDSDTHLVSVKSPSAAGTVIEGNAFTGFRQQYSGLWVQSRPNVTIQDNTFEPLANQSDFRAIVVGNWALQTGVPPAPHPFDVTIRANTFLANGAPVNNKGKAILFVNDNDASGTSSFTKAIVGGSQLADANDFAAGIGWYIALDDRTCTGRNHASTGSGCNGGTGYAIGQGINYTNGTNGSSISQKRPFRWDVNAVGNSFGGIYMPSMSLAQFNAVWAKTYDKHNASDTAVGNVLYGYPPITSGTITFTPTAFTYDGNAHPISATLVEDPGATCIVTPATLTNAGTHSVSATCVSSTHYVTGSGSVVVAKAAGSVVWGTLSFIYDGSTPTITATMNPGNVACTVTPSSIGPDAGSYGVHADCDSTNYAASDDTTATIAKAAGAVVWGPLNFTYDGSTPTITATMNPGNVACSVTPSSIGPNAGSYAVHADCDGTNHTASDDATATISKAAGTVVWGTLSFTYDGNTPTITAMMNPGNVACTVTPSSIGPNAGSYGVHADCDSTNYAASDDTTATIAKAAGAVVWGTLSFTYDGSTPTITATMNPGNVACTVTPSSIGPNAGSYAVHADCDSTNHAASDDTTATIAKAAGAVVWGPLNFTYDGNTPTITATMNPGNVACTVTPSTIGPNAGSYGVHADCDSTNYAASDDTTATIAKAAGAV
ncbi:MBG domain-containing protein, partial [Dokdonella sp.]|uniref:MBG domain-containing protein n=1 Tax=Dokdonella sp. TaxID=2291710 RepID=UPI00321F79CA